MKNFRIEKRLKPQLDPEDDDFKLELLRRYAKVVTKEYLDN